MECGYRISDLHRIVLEIGETELKTDLEKIPPALLKFLRSLPNSTTYQFVFVAFPAENVILPAFDAIDVRKLFADSLAESMRNRGLCNKIKFIIGI